MRKYIENYFPLQYDMHREPYDDNPVLVSTLSIIKGYPIPVDLVRLETLSEVSSNLYEYFVRRRKGIDEFCVLCYNSPARANVLSKNVSRKKSEKKNARTI